MYFFLIKCCLYTQNDYEQKNITTDNSVTNTRSIQQTPMFHGCTITNVNITINKTLSLENVRRHGAAPRFCLYVVNI